MRILSKAYSASKKVHTCPRIEEMREVLWGSHVLPNVFASGLVPYLFIHDTRAMEVLPRSQPPLEVLPRSQPPLVTAAFHPAPGRTCFEVSHLPWLPAHASLPWSRVHGVWWRYMKTYIHTYLEKKWRKKRERKAQAINDPEPSPERTSPHPTQSRVKSPGFFPK